MITAIAAGYGFLFAIAMLFIAAWIIVKALNLK